VQRLIANLLISWMMLLLPGATALQLTQPEILLPACCRIHGAHHCSLGSARQNGAPGWRAEGCPFSNLQHAAILLVPCLPVSQPGIATTPQALETSSAEQSKLSSFLAGLPGSRAPPSLS
jgi:hypothetical protein